MLARLMRGGGTLYILLAIYFAVNLALRLFISPVLGPEESRLFFHSQWLFLGYGGQAPLGVWMQYWVTHVLGTGLVSVALVENLLLFASYVFVGCAASIVIRNRSISVIAVLGMLLLPPLVYDLQRDGGASAAALMAAAFFMAGLFAMLQRGTLFAYVLAGLGIGAGFLANYDFALLFVAVLICMLIEPAFRARLWNWRIIFTLVFAGAALAMHLIWMRGNFELVTTETLGRIPHHFGVDRNSQIIEGLFSLAAALVVFFVPVILVFWFAFGRRFQQSLAASSPWTRLLARIFLLVLVAFIALIVFGGASAIDSRWLVPFFFMVPLYFCLKLDALNQTIGNAPSRFGVIAIIVMIAVPMAIATRTLAAFWLQNYSKIDMPYGMSIESIIAFGDHPPSIVFVEDAGLAGDIRLRTNEIPVVTRATSYRERGYQFDATHPLLVVWRGDVDSRRGPPQLARELPLQVDLGDMTPRLQFVTLMSRYGAGDVREFGYAAWVYPPAATE
jgi:4-amino-4-deoxy-L-arabinose transferase-like glycosyltransferase